MSVVAEPSRGSQVINMMRTRRGVISAVLTAVVLLAGCASLGGGADSKDPAVREKALRARVQARWDAMLALDMKRVYEFATPAYRQQYDLRHLQNQYAAQIERTRAEIYQVRFDPDLADTAKVVVLLHFRTEGGAPGTMIESYSRIVETWIAQDGQWWYVEPR